MRTIGHYVNGVGVDGTSGRTADVYNPSTGEIQAQDSLATTQEVSDAIAVAEAAQVDWAARSPQARARVLQKFLQLMEGEMDDVARLLSIEHGKTVDDAKGDIQRGLEVIEFCIGAPHLLKGEFSTGVGRGIDVHSLRQPLGVVAAITPFNFPAMIPLWKLGPSLAAGNAVILKPSERDPSVPIRLAEIFTEAGLPAGVLNVVNGDKEAVDALLTDPRIQAIGFVGSTPIAEYIYSTGTAHGKRVQAFGGAKNHLIIMPDADLDQAADALIGAGYGSAGERCMAISVAVPVGEEVAEALVAKLVERVGKLRIGPALAEGTDYGPLVTQQAKERVEAALREVQQLASASAGDGGLTGLLRVNSVEGFGRAFVTPALARLMNQNPGLRIEMSTGTRPIPQSIAADVEISVAPSSRRMAHNYALAKYHLALYASRDYLERRGAPRSAAELHDHPLIYYVESEMRVERLVVIQKHLPEADIRLGSPNVFIQVAATTAGSGIGLLPVFLARHEPGLVPVLEDEVRITLEFHASVANRPATQPASQAFLRELARELQARGSELLASD